MKHIENKTTSITDKEQVLSYVDLLKTVMNLPPAQGYTIKEMKQRLDIFAALTPDEKNMIHLEDAHFETVKTCVNEFRWGMLHKDIVAFSEYINTL